MRRGRRLRIEGESKDTRQSSSALVSSREHWLFTHHTIVMRMALRRMLGVWHMLKKPELVWYCAELTLRAC